MRLVSDNNFNGDIIRGLLRRIPVLDLVRVQDVGLADLMDPELLAWAAGQGRILLTHDKKTIPKYAYDRVRRGELMPGVFVMFDKIRVGEGIEALQLAIECSEQEEWENQVVYLPL